MAKVFNFVNYVIKKGLKLLSIEIDTLPNKLEYTVGEAFDPDGLKLIANFENNISGYVTGYTFSPTIFQENDTEIVVAYTYKGMSETISIPITVVNLVATVPTTSSSFTYDGTSHSPTWTNYDTELMTIDGDISAINAGSYYVTFTLKENVKWEDGSTDPKTIIWNISQASGSISLSSYSLSFDGAGSQTITVYGTGGTVSVSSSNTSVATASISGSTITVTPGSTVGSCTIYVTRSSTINYTSASTSISIKKIGYSITGNYTSAGTYSYTAKNTGRAVVVIIGGGGGGGGGESAYGSDYPNGGVGGGGGASGRITVTALDLVQGGIYNVVVGAGGTGGANSSSGTNGGTSSFGSTSVYGGGFGSSNTSAGASYGNNGAGGSGSSSITSSAYSGKDYSVSLSSYGISTSYTVYGGNGGGHGGQGPYSNNTITYQPINGASNSGGGRGGNGGSASGGTGGSGSTGSSAGGGGGGGGGGGWSKGTTGKGGSGGNGAAGRVIIYEKG